ncbi:MAG TPA: hypothetical protein VFM80_05695 [Gracilimonas sp.]|uniref:hypothetical protein n=1 Tax=Gracilimonas sp. TaxID=1974203 RepID=UPI002DA08AA3|nr:hypothetical protein [Gracilimonas sp.]
MTMNKGRLILSTLIISITAFSTAAYAQFEGQISMNVYSEDNGQTEVSELNLYATADRIMIKGEEDFDLMDQMSTDGVLIRNDRKDFVIMTGENQALQVTKIEIEGLVDMMASWGGESGKKSSPKSNNEYSFSDRTQTILGFEAAEMIIKNEDEPNKHLSIWLTPGIDINWGMLAEKWNNMPEDIDAEINGMTQEIIFKGRNFPMQIEAVEGDKRTMLMEVTNVNKSSVAKAMVEVPSGVTLMSFKDFVFQMMMQQ